VSLVCGCCVELGKACLIQHLASLWRRWVREGERRAAETDRRRVPLLCMPADRFVVVMKLL
jgi:hypothetical protein